MTEAQFLDTYQMERMREQFPILRLLEIHLPVTTTDMVVTGQIEDTEVITID